MFYLPVAFFLLLTSHLARSAEQTEHRDFQYNSVVDPWTGRYNFAYDTGNDNDIAHSLHMQYRDANGVVRGRYGYTDPNGKLRMVEYEAGPNGFIARGDVGPDGFLHDNAPEVQAPQTARFTQDDDLDLVPRPVQMAGWDPLHSPMGQPVTADGASASTGGTSGTVTATDGIEVDGYSTSNTTTGEDDTFISQAQPYDERYPRIIFSMNENTYGRELESLSAEPQGNENKSVVVEEYPVAAPLTVNGIDVNPDEIRVASTQGTTGRSADGTRYSRALPYSYRNYRRQTHDHDAERMIQGTGYRVVYRTPHDHSSELYRNRQTHDHDAERRYYVSNRQTHDHDAERKYYVNNRQTHDHDAERRYYVNNRQTHNHDAERRYYVNRQTHDHDAERAYYYRRGYYRDYYPYRRRIFYRDSHSMVPHQHYSDIYRNDNDRSHQHSDVQLYGRSQNLEVPPTAKPGELKYISSDKYHDKYYYWTD